MVSFQRAPTVFDLFQDLEGFSLDDYRPFSDVSSSLDRLAAFLREATVIRNERFVQLDPERIELVTTAGVKTRFTLNRDAATATDDLALLGLDHPIVQEELGRWRSLPPEDVGICVKGSDGNALVSAWLVETSTGKGERRTILQIIAARADGTRIPSVERQFDKLLRSAPASPAMTPDQRLSILTTVIEPALQRELLHKGMTAGSGSYASQLVCLVELV